MISFPNYFLNESFAMSGLNNVELVKCSLLKKIDVFSTEKNGDKRLKMALFRALNVGSWAMQG